VGKVAGVFKPISVLKTDEPQLKIEQDWLTPILRTEDLGLV
jgi:hypothetical protein